jgi:CRISPR-associated protein Csx14
MAEASIPVDLFNPGQVFACLGFLEAADVLLGEAEGGFDWRNDTDVRFVLRAAGDENPFAHVLAFLAETEVTCFAPPGYKDPPPKANSPDDDEGLEADEAPDTETGLEAEPSPTPGVELLDVFPARTGDRMALPIRLGGGNRPRVELTHWADDDAGRTSFKLYAGNRSADRIARAMLAGVRKKPTKKQSETKVPGDLTSKGLRQLWETQQTALIEAPFDVVTPMGGSFNFDPRGAWTAIDSGYSPNDQSHKIEASPVVEFLAAWGLQHARPKEFQTRKVRYSAWTQNLPPMLARTALICAIPSLTTRRFQFDLDLSGKNKVVTFAQEELTP